MRAKYYALDRNILAAATMLPSGNWGAYIGVVSGQNHAKECQQVLQTGTKLREALARVMFPELLPIAYEFSAN